MRGTARRLSYSVGDGYVGGWCLEMEILLQAFWQ
jgi:hypothetical protein